MSREDTAVGDHLTAVLCELRELTGIMFRENNLFICTEKDVGVSNQPAGGAIRMLVGHSALQIQQGVLTEGQEQLDASITTNLQRLAQEKALIGTGQQLVAQLIQGITQRMGLSCVLSDDQW